MKFMNSNETVDKSIVMKQSVEYSVLRDFPLS